MMGVVGEVVAGFGGLGEVSTFVAELGWTDSGGGGGGLVVRCSGEDEREWGLPGGLSGDFDLGGVNSGSGPDGRSLGGSDFTSDDDVAVVRVANRLGRDLLDVRGVRKGEWEEGRGMGTAVVLMGGS